MNSEHFVCLMLGIWLGIVSGFLLTNLVSVETTVQYKKGQIDAIKGKILFVLKTKEDGSTEWVKK